MSKLPVDFFLDTGMKGWIVNTAKREYWRVAQVCDFEELVQDGYLCYAKCRKAYLDPRKSLKGTKGERRWFQSLVKTAYSNHINTLAAKHKGVSVMPVSQVLAEGASDDSVWDRRLPEQSPETATLLTLLACAPAELTQLIQLLANDGLDLLRYQRRRIGRRQLRETTNEFYCRLIGKDPQTTDIVGMIKAHFG